MSLSIRLSRGGSKKRPYYKVVVADARSPRDGRFIEKIGTYNPLLAKDSPDRVKLDADRAKHWLGVGAQPSDRVLRFLDAAGVMERTARNNPTKGLPGEKAKERAEERVTKATAAAEAAAAAAAAPAPEPEPEPVVEEAVEAPAAEAAAPEPVEEATVAAPVSEEAAPDADETVPAAEREADAVEVAGDADEAATSDATNHGVSSDAPVEGAAQPDVETGPTGDSADKPAEG